MTTTVTGLFDTLADAQSAMQELINSGWTHEDISLIASRQALPDNLEGAHLVVKDAEKGAAVGGLAGLLIGLSELAIPGVGPVLAGGWLVTTLLGAGIGAATGGLVGSLVAAGMPHEQAGHFAEGVRRGGTLVTIKAEENTAAVAVDILRRHRAIAIQEQAAQQPQDS
ncbi:MAG TPA: hypothetical protein VFB38_23480 [Chthonomonadaceae bacterium]|nr:hypothetical protein [Chthonomonadaceae bacterium]